MYRDRGSREELPIALGSALSFDAADHRPRQTRHLERHHHLPLPTSQVGMKKTGFVLVAEQEPDVSREPPDSPPQSINWSRWPGTSDHVPSKAEARISEGQVLCAGEAASPASVWESAGPDLRRLWRSLCMYEDATPGHV